MPNYKLTDLKAKYKHLTDVTMPNIPKSRPEILIGLEYPKLDISYECHEGSWNESITTKMRLGWMHGRESSVNPSENYMCHLLCECNSGWDLDDLVRSIKILQ